MTSNVTITATGDNGITLDKLAELIGQRERYLKGETTQNAVTATAINVLTSIRARTRVADPERVAGFGVKVFPAPGVVAGYKSAKGSSKGRRVVRAIGGHEMQSAKIVNLAGGYCPGEAVFVFTVIFRVESIRRKFEADYKRVYVVARSASEVRAWAEKKVKKYIAQYRGMSKWAIGQAQSQIWRSVAGQADIAKGAGARRTALANTFVQVLGDGFASGNFSIEYRNTLDYATLSLKGGEADVTLALQKAANRTAAIINKLAGTALDEPIPTPFPEITK